MGILSNKRHGDRPVSEGELKLCALCGALNYNRNRECFTCGWAGEFSTDAPAIRIAWLRLLDELEAVEMRHVTRKASFLPTGYEVVTQEPPLRQALRRLGAWWRGVIGTGRRLGPPPDRTLANPGNELGV